MIKPNKLEESNSKPSLLKFPVIITCDTKNKKYFLSFYLFIYIFKQNRRRSDHKTDRNRFSESYHTEAQGSKRSHSNDRRRLGLSAAAVCFIHKQRAERYSAQHAAKKVHTRFLPASEGKTRSLQRKSER